MKPHIEQIKNALLTSQIVSRKVNLKQKGAGEFLGLCPFHNEKTPSFTVSDEKGFFHCFGCGEHGDIFSFIMKTEGLSYKETLERLAEQAGVALPKYTPQQKAKEDKLEICYQIFEATTAYYQDKLISNEGKEALNYLKRRGLKDSIIKRYRLGYAPQNSDELFKHLSKDFSKEDILESTVLLKGRGATPYNQFRGRVIFPICNKRGRIIAFGGRILGEGEPKYLNSPDNLIFKKGNELYSFDIAHKAGFKSREIVIVEGYMDVLALANAGIYHSVAPLGANVKTNQIKMLWQVVPEPTICMDADTAGRRAMAKIANEILPEVELGKSIKFAILQGGKDPDEIIKSHGVGYISELFNSAISLADLLFNVEKETTAITTPEKRAELKSKLIKLSDRIQVPDLQKSYRSYFMEKFSDLFKKKAANQNTKTILNQSAIVTALMDSKHTYLNAIFVAFFNHHELLEDEEIIEQLVNIEITAKSLDKLRNSLLSICDCSDNELRKTKLLELTENINIPQIQNAVGNNGAALGCFLHSDASYEDAREGVMRAFKINTLDSIREQIDATQQDLRNNPSEDTFTRLTELKRHEEMLKTELGIL